MPAILRAMSHQPPSRSLMLLQLPCLATRRSPLSSHPSSPPLRPSPQRIPPLSSMLPQHPLVPLRAMRTLPPMTTSATA